MSQIAEKASLRVGNGRSSPVLEDSSISPFPFLQSSSPAARPSSLTRETEPALSLLQPPTDSLLFLGNYRSLPVFQLLELVLNENVKILDFSKNRDWIESEEMNEFARILWKIVGEKCRVLEKFIIPKELTYSSTLNSVIGENRDRLVV